MVTSWREGSGLQDTNNKWIPQLPFVTSTRRVLFLNFLKNTHEEKGLLHLYSQFCHWDISRFLAKHATSSFFQAEIAFLQYVHINQYLMIIVGFMGEMLYICMSCYYGIIAISIMFLIWHKGNM